MNLTKAKILLDKINRLYTSMSLDEDNVATIEKDLMRDYVKQLYDAFLHETTAVPAPVRHKRVVPKSTYTPAPVVRKKIEVVTPTPPPPPPPPIVAEVSVPVVRTAPTPRVVPPPPPPRVVATPTPPPPRVVATPPPPPPPPPVIEATSAPVAVSTPRKVTPTTVVDPEHAELFQVSTDARELSEKLGQTRINDLNNAMGLNERIFTVNELFGADNSLYRNVIRDLNSLNSFEEATAYLSTNIAEKFNWTHKSKRNKAKNFIKLVKRRYL